MVNLFTITAEMSIFLKISLFFNKYIPVIKWCVCERACACVCRRKLRVYALCLPPTLEFLISSFLSRPMDCKSDF